MNNREYFERIMGMSPDDWADQAFRRTSGLIDARRNDGCVPVITTLDNTPTYL